MNSKVTLVPHPVSFLRAREDGDYDLLATLNFDSLGITEPSVAVQLEAAVKLLLAGAARENPDEIEVRDRNDAPDVIDSESI